MGVTLGCLFAAHDPTLATTLNLVGNAVVHGRFATITRKRMCCLFDDERGEAPCR